MIRDIFLKERSDCLPSCLMDISVSGLSWKSIRKRVVNTETIRNLSIFTDGTESIIFEMERCSQLGEFERNA